MASPRQVRAKSTPSPSPRNARPLGGAGERSKEVKTALARASLTCFLRSVMTSCISRINVFKSLVSGPSECLRVADVALLRSLPYFTLRGKEEIQSVNAQV